MATLSLNHSIAQHNCEAEDNNEYPKLTSGTRGRYSSWSLQRTPYNSAGQIAVAWQPR